MKIFDWQNELDRNGHRVVISGQAITMHCHHYNINLQKTLEDTLGEQGIELLYRSVEETNYNSLKNLFNHYRKIRTLKSRLEMASLLYQNCGLGIISFKRVRPNMAHIVSTSSHHVTGWLAKHGRRQTPGCHFARGWIAGALEAVYNQSLGYYIVEEKQCKMRCDDVCVFNVSLRK